MKKLWLVLTMAMGFAVSAQAQNAIAIDNLPTSVRAAFTKEFSPAEDMSWSSTGSNYSATFTKNNSRNYVEFSADGKLVEHRVDLKQTDLPATITSLISKEYASHTFEEAEKIVKNGVTTYEIELEGKPDYEIIFDAKGTVLERKVD
ncbi:PepSY-like domain-containing protein [Pedobacter sp. SYSU D00535]|uniref:PepSY-like domain-containing protein n=1 Tax=Pedobacter sp. SYSU D00535 TaxID=2810308 RepID=UPI001A971BBC|nr:PepSY-like domain-containing protein [Pedobacter sp. SYSU D00535]